MAKLIDLCLLINIVNFVLLSLVKLGYFRNCQIKNYNLLSSAEAETRARLGENQSCLSIKVDSKNVFGRKLCNAACSYLILYQEYKKSLGQLFAVKLVEGIHFFIDMF